MAEINLNQAEADALIIMEKHRVNDHRTLFPMRGESVTLPLQSPDAREQFLLDLSRGRIDLKKVKIQTRARQIVILVRLDLGGASHRNPDGQEISVPPMHIYREGYGDKWAQPVPSDKFRDLSDTMVTLEDFFGFCNITLPPIIERGLFT